MIDLTDTAAVYARARQAYENQELQAQQPKGTGVSFCSYNGPCAIGVSLTPEQRKQLEPDGDAVGITTLLEEGTVIGNEKALDELQMAHDMWNTYKDYHENGYENAADHEVEFQIQMWRY